MVEHEQGWVDEEMIRDNGYIKLKLVDRGKGIRDNFIPDEMEGEHYMFGGTFIWTSDSRFSEKYGSNPIPLHDRIG